MHRVEQRRRPRPKAKVPYGWEYAVPGVLQGDCSNDLLSTPISSFHFGSWSKRDGSVSTEGLINSLDTMYCSGPKCVGNGSWVLFSYPQ